MPTTSCVTGCNTLIYEHLVTHICSLTDPVGLGLNYAKLLVFCIYSSLHVSCTWRLLCGNILILSIMILQSNSIFPYCVTCSVQHFSSFPIKNTKRSLAVSCSDSMRNSFRFFMNPHTFPGLEKNAFYSFNATIYDSVIHIKHVESH